MAATTSDGYFLDDLNESDIDEHPYKSSRMHLPIKKTTPPAWMQQDYFDGAVASGTNLKKMEKVLSKRLLAIENQVNHIHIVNRKIDILSSRMNEVLEHCGGTGRPKRWSHLERPGRHSHRITSENGAETTTVVTETTTDSPTVEWKSSLQEQMERRMTRDAGVEKSNTIGSVASSTSSFRAHRQLSRATEYITSKHTKFQRIWLFCEDPESGRSAALFAILMQVCVYATLWFSFLQWLRVLDDRNFAVMQVEICLDIVFLLEVTIRFVVSPNRTAFLAHPYNWIDIVAAVPLFIRFPLWYYEKGNVHVSWFLHDGVWDGTVYDILTQPLLLGLVPFIRLLKNLKRIQNFNLLLRAFKLAGEAMPVLLFIYFLMFLLLATLLYLVEPRTNIRNFVDAMYLALVSLTTVGYGDLSPTTILGRFITLLFVVFSMMYMAIPLGIVGSCFSDVWNDRDRYLLMTRTRYRLTQWGYRAADIRNLFRIFDPDEDGTLDFWEFQKMVEKLRLGLSQERIRKLFDVLDNDGSGCIDDQEFVHSVFPECFHEIYEKSTRKSTTAPQQMNFWQNFADTVAESKAAAATAAASAARVTAAAGKDGIQYLDRAATATVGMTREAATAAGAAAKEGIHYLDTAQATVSMAVKHRMGSTDLSASALEDAAQHLPQQQTTDDS